MKSFNSWIGARPYWISLVILLLLFLWMGSGYPYKAAAEQPPIVDVTEDSEPDLTKVQVKRLTAHPIEQSLELYGRSEALRQSVISSEISGRLINFEVTPGSQVKKGDILAKLSIDNRAEQLKNAKTLLAQREIEFKGAKSLNRQGFQGEAALAAAKSALSDAQSLVKQLQLDLNNTHILAPYDGIFSDNLAEPGDFIGIGDPIAEFIDTSQIIIGADVSERHVSQLKLNQRAAVKLATGESITGSLNHIATVSDPNTNTFHVEVLVDNANNQLKAGVSAEISFPLAVRQAIKVTPAALTIADDGTMGIKTVKDGVVQFHRAELVRAENDGAWLGGLNGDVDVITLGQGFVRDGERVEVVWEN